MRENDYVTRLESMHYYGFGLESMKESKVCTHCGKITKAKYLFCRECGKKLPNDSLYQKYKEKHLYCSKCETIVSDTTIYCPQCGHKINNKEE